MIDRYTTPAMNHIWSRQDKYELWKEVEIAICMGWQEEGIIPAEDLQEICAKASFTLERCDELELETRHDLVALRPRRGSALAGSAGGDSGA